MATYARGLTSQAVNLTHTTHWSECLMYYVANACSNRNLCNWRVYCSQFEHPYSAAYCEIVSEFGNGDRKLLLEMAAKGVTDTSFWLTPLLIDLASIGDRNSGGSIARWTRVPEVEGRVMPQKDISVFVVAHVALAGLGCELSDKRIAIGSASAGALAACGAILDQSQRSC